MASAAGEIFDEYDGDALAIAEELATANGRVTNLVSMVEELRARGEKAVAVVQAWSNPIGPPGATFNARSIAGHQWPDLPDRLDELARAHGADGGKRDEAPELPSDEVTRRVFQVFDQPVHESPRGVALHHTPTGIYACATEGRTVVENVQAAYRHLRAAVAEHRARAHDEDGGQDR